MLALALTLLILAAQAAPGLPPAQPAPQGARAYVVDPAQSTLTLRVGRAGLFKFAGHEHEVVGPAARGEVLADPDDLARSSIWLTFEAGALRVTGKGEPPEDVPKVQAVMLGPKVLDAAHFPEISFRSRAVEGRAVGPGVYDLRVTGDLTLRGVTRSLTVPVRVQVSPPDLQAGGRTVIRHTDFGLKPVSVAGVVNVKNEIAVEFEITARAPR